MPGIPNPGSDEAIELGCICPVMDNHHGAGMMIDGVQSFWRTAGCPVHTVEEENDES